LPDDGFPAAGFPPVLPDGFPVAGLPSGFAAGLRDGGFAGAAAGLPDIEAPQNGQSAASSSSTDA